MLKHSSHTPAHLYLDHTPYFITGAIYQKRRLLISAELKQMLQETLQRVFVKYGWQLHHWVILDNHYHLLCQSARGKDLSKVMKETHFDSAIAIHAATNCEKPVWYNYWDYCPRNEQEYLIRENYTLYNPVKHGYVTDLKAYPHSSFYQTFEQLGRERLARQFLAYPEYKTLRLTEAEDDDF